MLTRRSAASCSAHWGREWGNVLGQSIGLTQMKTRYFGAFLAAAASVLVPQQAQALVVTSNYVQFKIFQDPANNVPLILSGFDNFTTAYSNASLSGPANLTGIGFKIVGNSNGTGSATVAGNPKVSNQSEDNDTSPFVSYAPKFTFTANGSTNAAVTGVQQNALPNPVNCVSSGAQGNCPGPGGNVIPAASTRTLNLQGSYSGVASSFVSAGNPGAVADWTTGTIATSTANANFAGTGNQLAFDFATPAGSSVASKPYIEGWIAIQYEYNIPPVPGAAVPGPLPLVGAAAAFGWSRRLKKRITSAA